MLLSACIPLSPGCRSSVLCVNPYSSIENNFFVVISEVGSACSWPSCSGIILACSLMTFYQWLAGSHGSGSLTAVNWSHFSWIAWSCPSLTTPRHSPVASSFQRLIIFSLLFCFTSFSEILSDESWICYLQPKTLVCVLSFSFVIVRDSPGTPSSVCPIALLFPWVSLREFFFGHFVYYQFFFSYFMYSLLFIFLFLYWYYLHYFILPFFFFKSFPVLIVHYP